MQDAPPLDPGSAGELALGTVGIVILAVGAMIQLATGVAAKRPEYATRLPGRRRALG